MDTYLPKYRQEDALIVNISSVGGTAGHAAVPVYCATKHAVLGMVRSWSVKEFYEETKIRVLGICPGPTYTAIAQDLEDNVRDGKYKRFLKKYPFDTFQE